MKNIFFEVWKYIHTCINTCVIFSLEYNYRMNEKGYVQTSYIDTICIVRAMGMANKTTLLKHIEDVHPGWIEDELKREASRRGPKKRWFKVPPVILSQILHPVSSKTKVIS